MGDLLISQRWKDRGDAVFCDASRCHHLTHNLLLFIPRCVCKRQYGCPVQLVAPLCRLRHSNATSLRLSWDRDILGLGRGGRQYIYKKKSSTWLSNFVWLKCLLCHVTDEFITLTDGNMRALPWWCHNQSGQCDSLHYSLLKTERWAFLCVCSSLSWQLSLRKVCIRSFGLPAAEC